MMVVTPERARELLETMRSYSAVRDPLTGDPVAHYDTSADDQIVERLCRVQNKESLFRVMSDVLKETAITFSKLPLYH